MCINMFSKDSILYQVNIISKFTHNAYSSGGDFSSAEKKDFFTAQVYEQREITGMLHVSQSFLHQIITAAFCFLQNSLVFLRQLSEQGQWSELFLLLSAESDQRCRWIFHKKSGGIRFLRDLPKLWCRP